MKQTRGWIEDSLGSISAGCVEAFLRTPFYASNRFYWCAPHTFSIHCSQVEMGAALHWKREGICLRFRFFMNFQNENARRLREDASWLSKSVNGIYILCSITTESDYWWGWELDGTQHANKSGWERISSFPAVTRLLHKGSFSLGAKATYSKLHFNN